MRNLYIPDSLDDDELRISIESMGESWFEYLSENPEFLYDLSPRDFEELVAELFVREGYNVQLTKKTRDQGVDIYAFNRSIAATIEGASSRYGDPCAA